MDDFLFLKFDISIGKFFILFFEDIIIVSIFFV